MKRGVVALILFCFCVLFSVYCTEKSKSELNNASKKIDEIRILCEDRETEKALEKAEEFEKEWNNRHFIFKISANRSAFKEIESSVISLPILIENGKSDKAVEQCEAALTEIKYMLDGEKINFENVF